MPNSSLFVHRETGQNIADFFSSGKRKETNPNVQRSIFDNFLDDGLVEEKPEDAWGGPGR